MNKEYVLVPKGEFLDMVDGYLRMWAGDRGGVDNWSYWGYAIDDFVEQYNEENKTNFEYMDEVVEDYANSYETITKEEE
jgi:hypothetical protein